MKPINVLCKAVKLNDSGTVEEQVEIQEDTEREKQRHTSQQET